MTRRTARGALAVALAVLLLGGGMSAVNASQAGRRTHLTAYFSDTNGLYPGDQVRILGVPVGGIDTITPGPSQVKVTFWYDRKYKVPADAAAAILSPGLVSARVIQLTPAYTGGAVMADNAVIPESRTAVPVEWDDLKKQLEKLSQSLQPSGPEGVAPLGQLINTGAANLRGEGSAIREAIINLSQALSALGDHSGDIFSTVKNLSVLVTALRSSSSVLGQLNRNLAAVSGLLANDPGEVGTAISDLDTAVRDVEGFVADNHQAAGTTFDKVSSLTSAVAASLPDIKQLLHVSPNSFQNFLNIYTPASGSFAGVFTLNNLTNPIQAICGSVQAASRLNYEQSAKLCVQYLAPIIKNRQYNFPPVGTAAVPIPIPLGPLLAPIPIPISGAIARPNEVTYSEDWMRPDYNYRPGVQQAPPTTPPPPQAATPGAPPAAEVQPDPAAGLTGLMVPEGGGS